MVLNIETTETDRTNQIHCEFSIRITFHRKNVCCKKKKICQKIAFNLSLGKLTLISVLQLPLEIVEARGSVLSHQKKAVQHVKQHPKRLSLCQPSKWAADLLKHFYCNSPATDLWKHFFFPFGKYQGSTSHPHPKQTIFQPTGTLLGSFIFQNTSSKFQTVKSVQNNSDFYFQPVPLPHFIYLDLCQ